MEAMTMRMPKHRIVKFGEAPVDSGQLLVMDPCYIESDMASDPHSTNHAPFYREVMRVTLGFDPEVDVMPAPNALQAGEVRGAVAFSTQVGDGRYPVYGVYDQRGNLLRVVIRIQSEHG
jgi:hypothetical protein